MATRVEHELKYRVRDRAAAERLLTASELAGFSAVGPVRTVQMEDRYVDTTDGALARAGYAARIRHEPGTTLVSVKALRRGGHPLAALHRREELEGPADRAAPPADWPSSAARALILELAGDAPLVEIVTIRQLRRRRAFADPTGELEASLDDVDVVSRGDVVARFTDLEIELRSGDPEALTRVAAALEREADLEPAPASKYEAALLALGRPVWEVARPAARSAAAPASTGPGGSGSGLELRPPAPGTTRSGEATSSGPEPTPAPPSRHELLAGIGKAPGVTADDTVAEAGRKVLRFHFARLLVAEDGTRSGADIEDLHKMRVATRRLRAAWRVFGDAYLPERTRRFPRELRALGRRLGAVRDLDVLIAGLETYRATLPPAEAAALDPLLETWRRRRDAARADLIGELDSDAYRRFVAAFEAFVTTEGAAVRPVRATEPHHVRDTAPSRIWRAHEQVRAYEGVLPWADVATLHELRIAAKWLRYAIEFVREALGPEAGPLIERVVGLQDHLGYLHDADVAAELTRRFLVDDGVRLSPAERDATGRYLVSRQRELARLRRSAGPPWRRVAGRSFRATLARCLARL
jgi:CHAD domain-containing protein